MLELELEVMLIGVGTKTDFLYDNLGRIRLDLLGLLALLVEILLVVEYLAHRGISLGAYLNEIKFQLVSQLKSLQDGINTRFRDIVADQTHLGSGDLAIDVELVLVFFLLTGIRLATSRFLGRLGFVRYCH